MSSLISLLSGNLIGNPEKICSLRGPALAGFTLIDKTKEAWSNALRDIGEIEICLELAKKLRKGEVCLSETCTSGRPYIAAIGYRNPLVKECKSGNLIMGDDEVNNMLITGPHGCGKSTAQRAIAYNVILASIFGIAYASKFTFTPFSKILVYADERGQVDKGHSSFTAQCDRINCIEKELYSLNQDEFCLTLTDEVFSGTMEEEGAKRYYSFCRDISLLPMNIFIGTTHFEKLINLEVDTHGAIRNFSVEIEEPEEGVFERSFCLVRGEPEWWFKDKEKRERFFSWLKEKSADLNESKSS